MEPAVQPTLRGRLVDLLPMQADHALQLLQAAADGELWNMTVTVVPGPDSIARYVATALAGRSAGTVMPFVIVQKSTGAIVGSTRFWKIDHQNRTIETDGRQRNCVRYSIIDTQ